MAGDIQMLQAGIGADVAQFLAGMQQAAASINSLVASQQQASAAARQVSEATAAQEAAARAQAQAARAAASAYSSDWNAALRENAARQREATNAAKESAAQMNELKQRFSDLTGVALGFGLVMQVVDKLKEFASECMAAGAAAEMLGVKTHNAFGVAAEETEAWAKTAGQSFGRTDEDMLGAAVSAKDFIDGMGLGAKKSTEMAHSLAEMGVQMSIAKNIPLPDVMRALNLGLTGNARALKELGIVIDPTTKSQEMLAEGLQGTFENLTEAEKATVSYNIITRESALVDAQAAAATGTVANQTAILHSQLEKTTSLIGGDFNGSVAESKGLLAQLAEGFNGLTDKTRGWVESLIVDSILGPLGIVKAEIDTIKHLLDIDGGKPAEDATAAANAARVNALKIISDEKAGQDQIDASVQKGLDAGTKRDQDAIDAAAKASAIALAAAQARAQIEKQAIDAVLGAQQKMDAMHLAAVQEAAQAQIKGAKDAFAAAHGVAVAAESGAKENYSTAKGAFEEASRTGDSGAIASARAAMSSAEAQVQGTIASVISLDQSRTAALNSQLAAQVDAISAAEDARKEADETMNAARLQLQTDINDGASDGQIQADRDHLKMATEAASQAAEIYKQAYAAAESTSNEIIDAQHDSDEHHKQAWKDAADYAAAVQRAADEDHKRAHAALKAMGSQALQSIGGGSLNSVISGAAQGSAAGPAGAAAGAALALLEQSKQAQATASALNGVLKMLADLLGQLLEPLAPLIRLIGSVLTPTFKEIGDVAKPLIGIVVEVLVPVLMAIQPVLKLLAELLENLVPVFNLLATVIRATIDGIAFVWDGLIDLVQSVLYTLGHILPSKLGDAATSAGDSLNKLKINVDNLNTAMVNAANGITAAFDPSLHGEQVTTAGAAGTVDAATKAAQQAAQNYAQSQVKVQGDKDSLRAMRDALAQTHDPKVAAELQKEIDAAQQQLQLDEDANNIMGDLANIATAQLAYQKATLEAVLAGNELAKAYRDNDAGEIAKAVADNQQATQDFAGANQALTDATNALHKDQTKQALDQAAAATQNTSATASNTKAINDLNATMANAPSGFRLALYGGVAAGASLPVQQAHGLSTGISTGALGGRAPAGTTVTGPINITVVTSDPKTAGESVVEAMRRHTYSQAGALATNHGGLFGG